jgi:hypothetical protein
MGNVLPLLFHPHSKDIELDLARRRELVSESAVINNVDNRKFIFFSTPQDNCWSI